MNSRSLWLRLRDKVVVQGEHGETLASVILKDPLLVSLKKPGTVTREIIRKAEEEDLDQDDHNRALEEDAYDYCRQRIELRDLKMELSEVEVAFRRNRITFYFTAEQRVDFRELVKDLASRFQTRIELRQIGVRDQAKRVDGCGPCGRAFCCSTWMKGFHPVTLKMAREQNLSLNPTKISGACGRLMCCLSYELAQYRDSAAKMPPVGTKIGTGKGPVTVTRTDAYTEAVWVRDEDGAPSTASPTTRCRPARTTSAGTAAAGRRSPTVRARASRAVKRTRGRSSRTAEEPQRRWKMRRPGPRASGSAHTA